MENGKMSKNSKLIEKYVFKYVKDFERRGDALYCFVCNQNITVKSITVLRHVNSKRHRSENLKRKLEHQVLSVNLIIF